MQVTDGSMTQESVLLTIRYIAWLGCALPGCDANAGMDGAAGVGAGLDRCRATASRTSDRNS
ncbi:MAG TPA: hypothetical protein VMS54_10005 [Vicinamibacterales bacterium]|nr:hypothetical protein [Vicinamibacterales bacterium]